MAKRHGRTRSRGTRSASLSPPSGSGVANGIRRGHGQSGDRRNLPDDGTCALCERIVERSTVHHLVPRARGGNHGPTAWLCPTCHRQVHAMFSVTTLAEELYSVELLRANPRVASFLRWMRKQRGTTFQVRRSRERN
ncbi:MAG: HNH endonuclease [Chloroflexi bacterium]|nr:HNH endonuclease [Chloroflexota bacterium]MYD48844.1 HNH endonuclease [Chloroflexota bacterium]